MDSISSFFPLIAAVTVRQYSSSLKHKSPISTIVLILKASVKTLSFDSSSFKTGRPHKIHIKPNQLNAKEPPAASLSVHLE